MRKGITNLLYITNGITGSGGLERVLSIKTTTLIDKYDYNIYILTLNETSKTSFFKFSDKVKRININVQGNPISKIKQYIRGVKNVINTIKPDVISVCDDGLKGTLFPIIFGCKIPVVYERHVSKEIERQLDDDRLSVRLKRRIKFYLMDQGAKRFNSFVVLSEGNAKEWKKVKNITIIPNPLPFCTKNKALLNNKKVLAVGKQSFQKGYDRLIEIWKIVNKKHPDWKLEVYGKLAPELGLEKKVEELGLSDSIRFFPPTREITQQYMDSSIYVMSSRYEGFGMVLIEAMIHGVPCVSFDCPYGPASIIDNNQNGFLIENGNFSAFANRICYLIEHEEERKSMGTLAIKKAETFDEYSIGEKWDTLFQNLIK